MTGWLFALCGAAAGAGEARLLARAARGEPSPLGTSMRLLLVGAVLLAAALAGRLACGAVGWTAGFAVAGALLQRSFR